MNKLSRAYRKAWMLNMLERENRMVDSALLATLIRSVSFFASGTIILVAGLATALGAADQVVRITAQLPFAAETNAPTVQIKFLILNQPVRLCFLQTGLVVTTIQLRSGHDGCRKY